MVFKKTIANVSLVLPLALICSLPVAMAAKNKLSVAEWAGVIIGNTVVDAKGKWYAYYHSDGSKITKLNGKVTTVTWRKKENGAMCEVSVRSNNEFCHDETVSKITEKRASTPCA